MSQLFASGGQSIGSSASASVLPMRIQGWFPFGLIGLISSLSKGLSRVFSSTTVQKHQFFSALPSLWSSSLSLFSSCSDWNPNSFSESAELDMVCSLRLLSQFYHSSLAHSPPTTMAFLLFLGQVHSHHNTFIFPSYFYMEYSSPNIWTFLLPFTLCGNAIPSKRAPLTKWSTEAKPLTLLSSLTITLLYVLLNWN